MPRYMLDDLTPVLGETRPTIGTPAGGTPQGLRSTPCTSCGKEASIRISGRGLYCGRCALLTCGDTVGTIASVVMDLGAAA